MGYEEVHRVLELVEMFVWIGKWEEGGSPSPGSSKLLYCLCDCWMLEWILQWLGRITQVWGCCAQPHPQYPVGDVAGQRRRGRSCWSVIRSLTRVLCWSWIASVPVGAWIGIQIDTKIMWLHERKGECTGWAVGERLEPGFGSVLDPGVLSQTCILGLQFCNSLTGLRQFWQSLTASQCHY